ncbi:MAG: hypothetical protein KAS65_06755 [Candidatus Aminicenantes bacterium]|nr:hypothetical protein [Candidatus Aminicenantes bacterium]
MKKINFLFMMVLVSTTMILAESFMEVAEPDPETAELILGTWQIQDSNYIFEFSKQFVRKFYGFKFYQYKTSQKPLSREYVYTVLKIKKYNKSYLCRGIYKNGRAVTFSTSMIKFIGKDWFKVFYQRNPRQIYFEAVRIKRGVGTAH